MTSREISSRDRSAGIEDLLYKTSRTFALTIPLLPEPLRREVGIAYLLFRVADTLEDATEWTSSQQAAELREFRALLDEGVSDKADPMAARWLDEPPLMHRGYLELLAELRVVMQALGELPAQVQQLICRHTQRTIDMMVSFVERRAGSEPIQIRDVADLQDYCYAVAGIVGELLTELFLLDCDALRSVANPLRRAAPVFGEALQLVNIMKDYDADRVEGRRYIPLGTDRADVLVMARDDLDTAAGYVETLQRAEAPRGLVEFCALPVLLARATLDRVEREGPGSKITRLKVMEIVQTMGAAIDSGQPAVPMSTGRRQAR